jgi:murein DD-endopeptidase MepM/ murein hydrolase activator NlpD
MQNERDKVGSRLRLMKALHFSAIGSRPGLLLNQICVVAIFMGITSAILTGCQNTQETELGTAPLPTQTVPPMPDSPTGTKPPTHTAEETPAEPVFPIIKKTPVTDFQLCSPLADQAIGDLHGIVSSPYDPPPIGKDDRHQGVDFAYYNLGVRASIEGEGVQAITPGWVAVVIKDRLPYGNMVILETPATHLPKEFIKSLNIGPGESIYHLYAHFSDTPLPSPGSWVECGQILGYVGKTGYNVPVAHLHLETRIGPAGTRFDGMVFYDTQASDIEMENYKTWRMSGLYRHFDPMTVFTFIGFESEILKNDEEISEDK